MHAIHNHPERRVVVLRMSGIMTLADLGALMEEMGRVCATYRGGKLAMIADLRDLQPLAPDVAQLLGQAIAMSRHNGVVVCAHLSNSGIIRLQTNRVSREAASDDASVFDVISLEEAWRLTAEHTQDLLAS